MIETPMPGDTSEALRDEARKLLDSADPATLEAVLDQLRSEGTDTEGGPSP
jgi:hypothetical protein